MQRRQPPAGPSGCYCTLEAAVSTTKQITQEVLCAHEEWQLPAAFIAFCLDAKIAVSDHSSDL